MYPPIKPFNTFYMKTDDNLHSIYIEECGNKNGIPIIYLHGGPGGSIDSKNRRYFNPKKYSNVKGMNIVADPKVKGYLKNNTTDYLIKDMEKIRNVLQIKKWIIYGGSWGSTLALIYAIKNNKNVLGLVLRGIFLGTKDEAYWAFNNSSKYFYPELIDNIENKFKKNKKEIFLHLGKMLDSKIKKNKIISSIIWEKYERTLSVLNPGKINLNSIKKIKQKNKLPNSPFLEWHYTKNNFFLKNNEIISKIKKIKKIPTIIIQGRYDLICPPKAAYLFAKNMSNCEIKIIENSGHSASEPNIKNNILKAIEKIYYKVKRS